jgi:hypothetical protein
VSKLRPVDHLRQLLIENHGPDNEVVKAFFALHTEVHAACSCLVLACSQAVQDSHVAELATRNRFYESPFRPKTFCTNLFLKVGQQSKYLGQKFIWLLWTSLCLNVM